MATITISVDDNTEHKFRSYVYKNYGRKKGILGKTINEAMESWLLVKKQEKIGNEAISMMKKGFNSGGFKFKSRNELHER